MKKGREYVTRGLPLVPDRPAPEPAESGEEVAPRLSSALPPEWLPRDYGMAGAFGAYEVRRLARTIPESLRRLTEALADDDDPVAAANDALDRLLPSEARRHVNAETFSDGVLTLSLARRADRFNYSRSPVPKLQAILRPTFGYLRITLVAQG